MSNMKAARESYPQYADLSDAELMAAVYKKHYSDIPVMGFVKTLMSDFDMGMDQVKEFSKIAKDQGADFSFSQPTPSVGGKSLGAVRGGIQGLTFGAGDEIVGGGVAALRKLTGDERAIGDIYSDELSRERSRIDQFRETNPALAYGSEIAGGVAAPLGAVKTIKGAAGIGLGTGAAAGFLGSEGGLEQRATGAVTGGVLGALLGSGLQGAAKGITGSFEDYMTSRAARAVAEGAESVEALKREASNAYEVANASGVRVDKAVFDDLITKITSGIAGGSARSVRPKLIPKASDALDAMKEYTKRSVGIDDLEYFRSLAQAPASMVTDKAEQRAASIMINGIDDFVDSITPDKLSVNPEKAQEAFGSLKKARELWARMRKTERIQKIIDVAEEGGYAGGFESGIKTQIGNILRNAKLRRGYSKNEISLLTQIQKGTPVGRILAGISYLGISPSGGRRALNASGAVMGGAAGFLAGGPIGALLGAGAEITATSALRAVREMSLNKQISLYADVLASGKADQVVKEYPGLMRYLQAVATKATTGGVTQTPYDILNK
tara:strand:- start:201 stop:1859 length:1659 start_codon:yes stop_codon:yes gene_type:complete